MNLGSLNVKFKFWSDNVLFSFLTKCIVSLSVAFVLLVKISLYR